MDLQPPVLTPTFAENRSGTADEQSAAVLGLAPHETDPVRVILIAHLRLRHCRRRHKLEGGPLPVGEMRRIVRARDALLRQTVSRLAARVAGRDTVQPRASTPAG